MNVLKLLTVTLVLAFVVPIARYCYNRFLVDVCAYLKAAFKLGTSTEAGKSTEKDLDPRAYATRV